MKKTSILMFAFLIFLSFDVQTASAQNSAYGSEGRLVDFYVSEIKQVQKEVDDYTPEKGGSLFYTRKVENFVLLAISRLARDNWAQGRDKLDDFKWSEWRKANPRNEFDAVLDKLALSVVKKLPTYRGNLAAYKIRNAAEEKAMKDYTFSDITTYQIYSVGLQQSNWLIAKNNYGIPTARYKHGAFYLKDKLGDHPYCYLIYVNVIQDYAGGGTYGETYARHIENELVGCPAGAK